MFSKQVAENITKQSKKLRANPIKRIPATSNFVYEFNPFANAEQLNPLTSQTCLRSTSNFEQKLPCERTGAKLIIHSISLCINTEYSCLNSQIQHVAIYIIG